MKIKSMMIFSEFERSHHLLPMQEKCLQFFFPFGNLSKICYRVKMFSEELYDFQTGEAFGVLLQDYERDCMNLLFFIIITIKIITNNSDIVTIVVMMIVLNDDERF